MYHFSQRGSRGFTLNELLTSIAILAILTTLLIANFQRGRLSDDLRVSAQNLAANLRRVQNLSTVGQSITIDGNQKVPPGGYGISIAWVTEASSYQLFADIAHNPGCQPSTPADAESEYQDVCDRLVEAQTVSFRPDVVIAAVQVGSGTLVEFGSGSWPDGQGGDDSRVDVAFKPPKPIPYLDGESGQTIRFELRHRKTDQRRTVTIIGPSGQVSERAGAIQ